MKRKILSSVLMSLTLAISSISFVGCGALPSKDDVKEIENFVNENSDLLKEETQNNSSSTTPPLTTSVWLIISVGTDVFNSSACCDTISV